MKYIIIFFYLFYSGISQKLDRDNRLVYYGTIASFYALSEIIPDHKPWLGSDTEKQKFEASNSVPTAYLIGINISAFTLSSIALSNNYYEDPSGLNNTIGHIEALVAEHAVTSLVKKIVQRERPNKDKDKVSFWSGHAAASFTTATYMTNYINDYSGFSSSGKFTAGLLSFAFASYVSWTRIDDYQHHTSDVIAGALWGIIASNFIYRIRNDGLYNMFSGKRTENKSFSLSFQFKL